MVNLIATMNTIPDTTGQAAPFQTASSKNAEARFVNRNLHRIWRTRRMKAKLLHPVRKVLKPLASWLQQEHFHVSAGHHGSPPTPLSLRHAGWKSLALGIILAPLAFIMLLPLLILIFPLLVVVGIAAVLAAAWQTNEEDTGASHHTLAWHAVH